MRSLRETFLWNWARKGREFLRLFSYGFRKAVDPASIGYEYQYRYIRHQFVPGERVLDIGSGGSPFPFATVLADRFLEPTAHRAAQFQAQGKPVVICDIHRLPFADRQFDFVMTSHVLEHVDDPIQACRELQRVGEAGYIETPTMLKDALFSWAKGMHKWHLVAIGNRLVFFEYSARQLEGIQSNAWQQVIFGSHYHPLQEAFMKNQDLFNVMFEWKSHFEVTVMKLDGTTETLSQNQCDSLLEPDSSDP
jgi:SAM-dependent methyltransferase